MTGAAAATGRRFDRLLEASGVPLKRRAVSTLQVNLGMVCNQACHHCHVEAGPTRTETMGPEVAERVLELLAASPSVELLDLTGGAPEIHAAFRVLVEGARRLDRRVIVRSNLTVLLEPGQETTIDWLAAQRVGIVASLPCYTALNTDRQRGGGVFDASIEALGRLNAAGFGLPDSDLGLDLVFNPGGPSLPPPQAALEADYHDRLQADFGVRFHRLFTITNMPIKRFDEDLRRKGRREEYLDLLEGAFRAENVDRVMCRDLVSVGWDGRLYDCDFNQMLGMDLPGRTVFTVERFDDWAGGGVLTGDHCMGCTAGVGSSCGGSLS